MLIIFSNEFFSLIEIFFLQQNDWDSFIQITTLTGLTVKERQRKRFNNVTIETYSNQQLVHVILSVRERGRKSERKRKKKEERRERREYQSD